MAEIKNEIGKPAGLKPEAHFFSKEVLFQKEVVFKFFVCEMSGVCSCESLTVCHSKYTIRALSTLSFKFPDSIVPFDLNLLEPYHS